MEQVQARPHCYNVAAGNTKALVSLWPGLRKHSCACKHALRKHAARCFFGLAALER
jgi:hypothetical protein